MDLKFLMTCNSPESLMKELESANRRIFALECESAELSQQDWQQKVPLQAITQTELFLAQSAKMAHLGYAIWDDTLDRDIIVSDELAKIHGLTNGEYIETVTSIEKYLELVAPEDREKYRNFEELSSPDDTGTGIEYRIVRPDGEIRHLHQRSQYIPISSGEPTRSIVVIQDVTDAKQVEFRLEQSRVALEKSEALLTQSVAMANLGHGVWDYVGEKFIDVSSEWARIFGYTREEYLTNFRNVEQDYVLIHPDDVERYRTYYEEEDSDNLTPDIEYRIVTRNHETRHLLQSHRYVFNESGERTKSLITIQDITERIERETELDRARRAAEQASVAKSSFLAMMSHEIRTPLNAVLGSLGLMDSKILDPSLRKYLNVGRNGAESLLMLINDILDFSKMEAGKLQLEPALFRVPKIIDDVQLVLEQQAIEKNISLTGDLDKGVPEFLIGDLGRIRQVLLNLCSNAIRFTTEGGVHISLSRLGLQDKVTGLRFQVEDTGCGVSLEDQEHLFEEFWGTSTTTLGDIGSTGLGLPICKKLVDMMGGSIGFESSPGRGSIFWFELPLKTADEAAIKIEKNKALAPDNSADELDLPTLQGRVLLAEDNPANQLIERTVLERLGLFVGVAANGKEVIAALHIAPYDLVLMDINMPEMDGIEATAIIRKMPGTLSNIPIIAMTALAMQGDRERFLSEGMDGYISKPIIREELHACIAKVLEGLEQRPLAENNSIEINVKNSETQIFDANIFAELKDMVGPEQTPKIIYLYLSQVPEQVALITEAAARGDYKLVAKEAHNLISSSAYLGAIGLSALASRIEQAERDNDMAKIEQEVSRLPSLFRQTQEKLEMTNNLLL